MKSGFTVYHRMVAFGKPNLILVTNFSTENEVGNYVTSDDLEALRAEKSRSDVGVWNIKYKSHA